MSHPLADAAVFAHPAGAGAGGDQFFPVRIFFPMVCVPGEAVTCPMLFRGKKRARRAASTILLAVWRNPGTLAADIH